MSQSWVRFPLKLMAVAIVWSGGCLPMSALAVNYGIYDARGLAMGGATVATASWHSAQYYNAALLAFHDEREEDTRHGRVVFPNVVIQADNVVEDVVNAANDDLDQRLGGAVSTFNAAPSAATAAQTADLARELDSLLDDLANEDVNMDAVVSFSVSEPSLLEGGAFYFGVRTLGLGTSTIPPEDSALLERYILALDTVADGGAPTDIPAELLDANGNLIDPTEQLTSTVDVGGVVISEWAVAVAKQFDVFDQALAIGVTPKVIRVDVFRETTNFDTDELDFLGSQRTYVGLNADVGIALEMFGHYRIGFAVKDIIPEEFETDDGLLLKLNPRPRMGFAYVNDWLTLGLDVDVIENEAMAAEAPTQETSLGLAISPFEALELCLGYRQDMTGLRDDVIAGGVAYQFKGMAFELSYATGSTSTGAGLQLGWVF